MKLNNFLSDTPRVQTQGDIKRQRMRTSFNLENQAKDLAYQKEIQSLQEKLDYYEALDESFEALKRSNNALQESHADSSLSLSKAEEQASILNLDLTQAQAKLNYIPDLEETIKGLKGTLSDKTNELDNMQKVAHQQSSDLMAFRSQVDGLQNENTQLLTQTEESVSHSISAEQELDSIKSTFNELEMNISLFGKENSSMKKELSEIKDVAIFWKTEAQEASIRINQLEELETRLREWISSCEVTINTNASKSVNAGQANEELQKIVAEMGTTMSDLMQELTYVNGLNTEYRKEVNKPRYASMGAISAKEGFVIPLAKENLRKKFLGNSSPTLMKFRAKESK